jgi:hypothetical protein
MIKKQLKLSYLFLFFLLMDLPAGAQQSVQKTNPMKVYMHYMPWFETPATIGRWGWHWTMNNMNPNIIGSDGKRQIASYYYPFIGPYASRDKDVIEYHLLLMKLSGVDGILIDWYGVAGSNGDINDLLRSSDSIVSYTDDFGLEFGVVLEDRFSRSIADAKTNITYLKDHYFNRQEYIRYGPGNDPLLCIFGPVTFETPANWAEILPSAGEEVVFITLWYESGEAGSHADGEFAWVYQDNTNHITHLDNFYKNRAPTLKTSMGSVYPGFEDFYEEGGAGQGFFTIPPNDGSTLDAVFQKTEQYQSVLDMVHLVTFNDFGEGTMFEPTMETEFSYLIRLQEYTGVSYGEEELRLVHRLYILRKDYKSDTEIQRQLNQASVHLRNLEISEAAALLNVIEPKTGIPFTRTGRDPGPLVFPNPFQGEVLYIEFNSDFFGAGKLTISDVFGRDLYEYKLEVGASGFSIDNLLLPQGIYFINLYMGDSPVSTSLLITE